MTELRFRSANGTVSELAGEENPFPVQVIGAIKPDVVVCVGYEQITVSTAAVGFTESKLPGVWLAVFDLETAQIRWRADGQVPTSTVGGSLLAGAVGRVTGDHDLANFRAIRATTADATLNVTYFARIVGAPAKV